MNTVMRSLRIKKATEVIELVENGLSVTRACKKVGLSRSSFYDIRNREPELFIDLQVRLSETIREQMSSILVTRVDVLYRLIQDGLAEDTKPLERLAIFKETEKQLERLSNILRMSGGDNQAATDVLSGPIFLPGTSRFIVECDTQS
jgi:hypothetical protein